jgi:hypothetical protein
MDPEIREFRWVVATDDLVNLQCRLEKMLKNKSIRKDFD